MTTQTPSTTSPVPWQQPESPTMRPLRFFRGATSIQTMSLVFLVLQNSTLITVMHRSRMAPSEPGHRRYLVSTAMLLVELTKLVVSLAVDCRRHIQASKGARPGARSLPQPLGTLYLVYESVYQSLFSSGSWMLILPAGLYALQTRLVYIAVSNMETVPFQVTYQLKILTTVLFSIIMVQRVITPRQWMALVLLAFGVAIVQVAESSPTSMPSLSRVNLGGWLTQLGGPGANSTLPQATTPAGASTTHVVEPVAAVRHGMNTGKGFAAAIAAAFISGFTGVYFEKLIKESRVSVSLWTRNAQLSFYSLFPIAILGVYWKDGATIAHDGFFVGYGPTVWATIGLQALGGILVAICITYADNVAKNFAASFSIVVSYVANSILFGESMTLNSSIGISTVLFALYLYQSRNKLANAPLLPVKKDGVVVRTKQLHDR